MPAADVRGRLLTDGELQSADEPTAASEDSATTAWLRSAHHPIRSLSNADDFSDLAFLGPLLAGKRLVQLGESGHGVREFNRVKVRLIRYLHQELGFDVIAFESGLSECWHADQRAATAGSEELMQRCIFQVWHTREVLPLFDHLRASKSTARPLTLAGFDVQTSTSRPMFRPALLREAVGTVDSAYAARVFALDSAHMAQHPLAAGRDWTTFQAYRLTNQTALTAGYDTLARFLAVHRDAIRRAHPSHPELPVVAERAARNAIDHLRADGGNLEGWNIRDRGMADNIDFLLDSLYPGRRIVVWAHNMHVDHQGAAEGPPRATGPVSMGSWIARRRRADVYTVGLVMYRGQAATNSRNTYDVALPHRTGSVESILFAPRRQFLFVDLLGSANVAGTAWMFGSTVTKQSGVGPYALVPRASFDALLFVDAVRPPEYVPAPRPNPAP